MATSLHNYPHSPNPSTRSFDSSSVASSSAASPRLLPALHGRFNGSGSGSGSGSSSITSTRSGSLSDGRPPTRGFSGARPLAFAPALPGPGPGPGLGAGPQPVGVLPGGVASRLPSLHEHKHGHEHHNGHQQVPHDTPYGYRHQSHNRNHNYPLYGHEHEQHTYEHHHHHHHTNHPRSYSHTHPYLHSSMGRGDSLPPPDSLASTPGPGYIALPPLNHDGGGGGGGGAPPPPPPSASTSASIGGPQHPLPSSAPYNSTAAAAAAAAASHQQQQQQHAAKRAYRQRRKDPSCDACRERKVKCDATETTSCSECSNRQVKCQFTKETNRRMSSIKQMQDLERQLDRLRRENGGLRRILQEVRSEGGSSGGGGGSGRSGDPTPNREGTDGPARLDADTPMADHSAMEDDDYYGHQPRQLQHHHRLHRLPLLPIPDIGSNPPRRHRRAPLLSASSSITRHPPSAYPSSTFTSSSAPQPLFDLGRARANLRIFARGLWTPPTTAPTQQTQTQLTATSIPELPPRDAVETLLHAYYTSVHTMLPMIHWPTFQRQVDELYRTGPSPETPPSFVALFFSVLAVGGLFSTYFINSPAPSFTAIHLAEAARSLIDPWTMTTSPSPTIDDVCTLLLLAIFLNESNLKSAAWTWIASALRVAQAMRLYVEPADQSLDAEMRRRVWWALYVVDHALALDLGNRPTLIQDDDCDVALPTDDRMGEPSMQPQTMLAVLDVVRAYTALSRLLTAACSSSGGNDGSTLPPSSPLSTPSPSSSFAVPATTPPAGCGTHLPATHLATFDQHFAARLRVFPPACDPAAHYYSETQQPTLSLQLLNPLVYLLHARLVLHRHNLVPYAGGRQQSSHYQQARLTAVEQCTHTALETATLVRRTGLAVEGEPGEQTAALAAGATSLLTTHLLRCTLFLLLTGYADAAALLVRALATISVVRREVATPCGRFLAFFTSCLAFKRAEYTAYLARAAPQGAQGPQAPPGQTPTQPAQPTAPQSLYDALVRDEELLVYVSADLQSSPESAWVWEGEAGATVTTETPTDVPPAPSSSGNSLTRSDIRMGLSDDESRDWGGWDRLENRVRSLASFAGPGPAPTAPATAGPPPPTSYSATSTTTGTTSPVAHYTHQPMSALSSLPSMSTLPPLLPGPRPQLPPPQQQQQPSHSFAMEDAPSGSTVAPRRVDSPVAGGSRSGGVGASGSGSANSKSKNQDRISIANII